jgi:predicted ATPase
MLDRRDGARGLARLVMLEPIREFAAEAGAAEHVGRRHAEHYAAYAEAGREGMYGRDRTLWRDLLTDDIGNLRAALGWAIAHGDRELALRIAVALRTFWDLRWLTPEGDEWLSRALAVPGDSDPALEARAMLPSRPTRHPAR